jgi:hypothetical protein
MILHEDSYSAHFYDLLTTKARYVFAMGGRGCFAKKQLLQTNRGLKKISKMKVGDVVKSYNVKTKEIEYKRVINTFKYENQDKCIKFVYDGKVIICTLDHKFFYKGEFVQIAKILEENGIKIN